MASQPKLDVAMSTGEHKFNLTDYRVWGTLLRFMQAGNYVNKTQGYMADQAGLAQSHFSASLKRLMAKDFVTRVPSINGSKPCLMVSPFYVFKGSGPSHRMAQEQYKRHWEASRKKRAVKELQEAR